MRFFSDIRSKYCLFPGNILYAIFTIISIILLISTVFFAVLWSKSKSDNFVTNYAVEKGIIGSTPRLPNDGRYVQWTFLHMNDVYELLPLDQKKKGGLARVAYMRKLLLQENSNTITVLAGDLISPSAFSIAEVNGTRLNGKQMISTMNTLGLDYMTFGNHEFDISQSDILSRMNESKFTWISSNVFRQNTTQPFGPSIPYKIVTIDGVRILIIAYTIDGTTSYVTFINQASLVNYTKQFLTQFPNGSYDVLVALTHLDMSTDMKLAANIPQINVILGGHEHENYYYLRGPKYTPIYKADANAATVYIHRCAYNIDTKQFRIYSTLARVTSEVPEDLETTKVATDWYELGLGALQALDYDPTQVISCLPADVELDGRSEAVRSSQTLLSDAIGAGMIKATSTNGTTISVFNSGAIRIDDVLRDNVTQYDVLRVLPFSDVLFVLSIAGDLLAHVLKVNTSAEVKGRGTYLSYYGVQTSDGGLTWYDQNGTNIDSNSINYTVVTIGYVKSNTELNNGIVIGQYNITPTKTTIDYLKEKYPPY